MNIECLTYNKASILLELCNDTHCHCPCLQETHRAKDLARLRIPGMELVAKRPHNKHVNSGFVRDGLKVMRISEDNVEFITVELPDVVVHSAYKPPAEQFLLPSLGSRNMHHIVFGDFNRHNTLWGYTSTDNDRRSNITMGYIKQHITHTQCESAEIIQQCYMEERVQP